jgi:hypothetical protein
MVKRCVLGGCSNKSGDGVPLFGFPDHAVTSKKWDGFVITTRKDWKLGQGSKHNQVCALHFEPSSFANAFKWSMGYTKSLRLEDEAVPSVKPSQVTDAHRTYFTKKAGKPLVDSKQCLKKTLVHLVTSTFSTDK